MVSGKEEAHMSDLHKQMTDYFVICVNEFAAHFSMSPKDALLYLDRYKGLDFLEKFYDVEHTFSFEDTVLNLAQVCRNHGGSLA